ncbi:hypothetical protein OHB26_12545 [Nocardia sp. NBC_01503]|uniref:hypothetical protein n=1 Tax=Nocardia sp. NBC_01503 TaxID=2975997 RepID=UPI002E7C1F7F|nr:hypothetical protein [Nocardia sp. NBC_01503]WTL34944.1 hypothetical protein OHB26_12545 [Nocardia sp. NBC_01503]
MTQADIDDFVLPELTGVASVSASTPMQRAANQLQKVLPPGWQVEVVESSQGTARLGQPVLRLVMGDF